MQQRYRTVEFLLRHFVARCGEVHRSQLLGSPMLMFLRHAARGPQDQNNRKEIYSGHFALHSRAWRAQRTASGEYPLQAGNSDASNAWFWPTRLFLPTKP